MTLAVNVRINIRFHDKPRGYGNALARDKGIRIIDVSNVIRSSGKRLLPNLVPEIGTFARLVT
jgi:hypothetical protein